MNKIFIFSTAVILFFLAAVTTDASENALQDIPIWVQPEIGESKLVQATYVCIPEENENRPIIKVPYEKNFEKAQFYLGTRESLDTEFELYQDPQPKEPIYLFSPNSLWNPCLLKTITRGIHPGGA